MVPNIVHFASFEGEARRPLWGLASHSCTVVVVAAGWCGGMWQLRHAELVSASLGVWVDKLLSSQPLTVGSAFIHEMLIRRLADSIMGQASCRTCFGIPWSMGGRTIVFMAVNS